MRGLRPRRASRCVRSSTAGRRNPSWLQDSAFWWVYAWCHGFFIVGMSITISEPCMSSTEPTSPTARTRVRRVAHRGHYDRTTLHAILDEAYVCHIAFADEHGVHCIPTACWREGDHLYIHGSNGSRMLKLAGSGAQVCVTITHIDGLVLARSAFNHSMNYRSAVIYGAFEVVPDAQKPAVLDTFM